MKFNYNKNSKKATVGGSGPLNTESEGFDKFLNTLEIGSGIPADYYHSALELVKKFNFVEKDDHYPRLIIKDSGFANYLAKRESDLTKILCEKTSFRNIDLEECIGLTFEAAAVFINLASIACSEVREDHLFLPGLNHRTAEDQSFVSSFYTNSEDIEGTNGVLEVTLCGNDEIKLYSESTVEM